MGSTGMQRRMSNRYRAQLRAMLPATMITPPLEPLLETIERVSRSASAQCVLHVGDRADELVLAGDGIRRDRAVDLARSRASGPERDHRDVILELQLPVDAEKKSASAPRNEFSGESFKMLNFVVDIPVRVDELLPPADQLAEEGVEMSWDTYLVPYGRETSSTVHALNFAARAAMKPTTLAMLPPLTSCFLQSSPNVSGPRVSLIP